MEVDRILPHDERLERDVLGAVLLESDAINEISFLTATDFYNGKHQVIFESITTLNESGTPIDILTVTEELRRIGKYETVGGAYFVSSLTNNLASAANIEYHGRILAQKAMQREFISTGRSLIEKGYNDTIDVFELSDWAEKKMFDIVENRTQGNAKTLDSTIEALTKKIKQVAEQDKEISGVPSLFPTLDNITGGWQPSDLIILAARPGVGKTSFALQLVRNASGQGYKTLMFSLEMSDVQLSARIVSAESGISSSKMLKHGLSDHELDQYYSHLNALNDLPLEIDDTAGITISSIRSICRVMKKKKGLDFIVIDYIQLIEVNGNMNRNDKVGHISRNLKLIAKELDVPVIALSQLSRAVETRGGDKRPQLSDLRDSGSIEQDADSVMFLYRPEAAGITGDDNGEPLEEGYTELDIAKHRSGALDKVRLKFIERLTKFEELKEEQEYESNSFPGKIEPNIAF